MLVTRIKLALAASVILISGIAHAKTVTILPFHGDTVHEQIRSAARDALSIFLTDNGLTVRGNKIKEPITERSKAAAAAKAAGVNTYIEGRITRLGQRAIVQVLKFDVNSENPVYSDRMTAANPSDLETVMQRLAASIASGKRAKVNENIHTVTRREQKALKRKTANQYFGIGLGGAVLAAGKTEFLPTLGAAWLWDNRNFLFGFDLRLGGFGTDTTTFEAALAGYYPLLEADTTPYIGGGLSLGGMTMEETTIEEELGYEETEDKSGSGLSVFAAAGVLIGRTSNVSIRPEIAYSLGTYDVDSDLVHGVRLGITLGF